MFQLCDTEHGLRRFLADLSGDKNGKVAIPTTLNSAGCDHENENGYRLSRFSRTAVRNVHSYSELGIDATLSCTPYDGTLKRKKE